LLEPNRKQEEALYMDVGNLLAKASDNFSVRRAFGTAYERDGMLIIPVAIVAGGGGGGTSRGQRGHPADHLSRLPAGDTAAGGATDKEAVPTDTGGGFGGLVLPSGVYVVRGDQVRWVPSVDVTLVAVAALSLLRILTRTRTRGRRRNGQS
jgi:uncharacterized spore protein YtfJ